MQTVILAGGIGTRLRPLTHKIPKPMVKVHNKPFLEHLLQLVKSYGLSDILILASYLGTQIEDYFGDGSSFGLKIKYSYEETPLGTGGALKNAEKMLANNFVLLNGDTLLPINYSDLVEQFQSLGKLGVIVAYSNPEKTIKNNLSVADNGSVLKYDKANAQDMTHIDAGVIVLNKKVLGYISDKSICSLESEIFPQLIQNHQLHAFKTEHKFYDMGSMEGLKNIEEILA
ncbi:MAG: NTP transferase domain-containing protein [Planctomycetes bacterium]|nr:NTP transferase domain-containing protein [Planctomycetota bacterium]